MDQPEEDHEQVADELEGQADHLEQRNKELRGEISDVRQDWQQKRASEGVPGAPPPPEQSDRDAPGDQVNPEDAEREEHESPHTHGRADADDDEEDDG